MTVRLVVEDLTPDARLPIVNATEPYPEDYFVGSDRHDDQEQAYRYFADPDVRIVANRLLAVRFGIQGEPQVIREDQLDGQGVQRLETVRRQYVGGLVHLLTHVNTKKDTIDRVVRECLETGLVERPRGVHA